MQEASDKAAKDTAMEDLFPNRGDTPLPCPFKTGELVGKYRDAGYGTMSFTEVPHFKEENAKNGETMLEGVRRDACIAMRYRLVPATGLHWLAYMKPVNESEDAMCITMRAEFKVGIDGKVEALEIDYTNEMLGVEDGKVLFKKIKE